MIKGFGFSFDNVVYGLSYANVIMLSSTLPTLGAGKKGKHGNKHEDVINAEDPANREKVKAFFDSVE